MATIEINAIENYLNKPKAIDFYNVCSQLYMLLSSGMNLQQALLNISGELPNKQLGKSLKNISHNLSTGLNIEAAFKRESLFPRVVAPTISAGYRAGQLPQTFLRLSEIFWLQHNLYSKIKNALFIPKIASVIMVLMIVGYVKIAIPEYLKLYKENGIEVPGVVLAVTNTVNGIVDYWYITLLVLFLSYQAFIFFVRNNSILVDKIKLQIPIYSKLHFSFLQHQFCSIINLMLSSGLTIPEALTQASKVVENKFMAQSINKVRNEIMKGNNLNTSLKKHNTFKTFDTMLIASINAGEKSNHLSEALLQACKYYERTITNMIEPISTKLTLLVMIPMGVFIVLIFAFTLVPMFNYISQVTNM